MKHLASILISLIASVSFAEYIRQATETYPGGGSGPTNGVTAAMVTNIWKGLAADRMVPQLDDDLGMTTSESLMVSNIFQVGDTSGSLYIYEGGMAKGVQVHGSTEIDGHTFSGETIVAPGGIVTYSDDPAIYSVLTATNLVLNGVKVGEPSEYITNHANTAYIAADGTARRIVSMSKAWVPAETPRYDPPGFLEEYWKSPEWVEASSRWKARRYQWTGFAWQDMGLSNMNGGQATNPNATELTFPDAFATMTQLKLTPTLEYTRVAYTNDLAGIVGGIQSIISNKTNSSWIDADRNTYRLVSAATAWYPSASNMATPFVGETVYRDIEWDGTQWICKMTEWDGSTYVFISNVSMDGAQATNPNATDLTFPGGSIATHRNAAVQELTKLATTNDVANAVSGIPGMIEDAVKRIPTITKNGYHLNGDLTYGASPLAYTNDLISLDTEYVHEYFGSYFPTNFVSKGSNGTTGIWECVYFDSGKWTTNTLTVACEKLLNISNPAVYDAVTISGVPENPNILSHTYFVDASDFEYQPKIVDLKINIMYAYYSGGTTTQRYINFNGPKVTINTNEDKVLTDSTGLMIETTLSGTVGKSRYNPYIHSIQEFATNEYYKYTLISSDHTYSNVFYTTTPQKFNTEVPGKSTGSKLYSLYGSYDSGYLAKIDNNFIGYISVNDTSASTTRTTILFKIDKWGSTTGYNTYVNPDVICVTNIDTDASWMNVDRKRSEEYLKIATDRIKSAGGGSTITEEQVTNIADRVSTDVVKEFVNTTPSWSATDFWALEFWLGYTSSVIGHVSTITNEAGQIISRDSIEYVFGNYADLWAELYDEYSLNPPVIASYTCKSPGGTISTDGRLTVTSNGLYTCVATDTKGNQSSIDVPIQSSRQEVKEVPVYQADLPGTARKTINDDAKTVMQSATLAGTGTYEGEEYKYWNFFAQPTFAATSAGAAGNVRLFAIGTTVMASAWHYPKNVRWKGTQVVGGTTVTKGEWINLYTWAKTNGFDKAYLDTLDIKDIAMIPLTAGTIAVTDLPYLMSEEQLATKYNSLAGLQCWSAVQAFAQPLNRTFISTYGDSWTYNWPTWDRDPSMKPWRSDMDSVLTSRGPTYPEHSGDSGHPIYFKDENGRFILTSHYQATGGGPKYIKGFHVIKAFVEAHGGQIRELP